MSVTQTALIIGATGQTGRHVLNNLLASPHFTRVSEYGRRVTSKDDLTTGLDKLEQRVIDFDKLQDSGLNQGNWDVVFITLGTTRANAGSAEAFERIDREYVINTAKEARKSDSSSPQRLVYLSSTGANSTSPFLYPRSKGLTERGLASLGYTETIIFRPGFLAETHRSDHRLAENLLGKLTGLLSYVSSSMEISVCKLGKAIYLGGKLGVDALPSEVQATQEINGDAKFTVINNAGALKLALLKE